MESIQALREHVKLSDDLERRLEFLTILDEAEEYLRTEQHNHEIKLARCINIEGIDGVGKTTLAKALANRHSINGHLLSVSPELKSFRSYFDKQNESTKRSFFHLWDINVSSQLLKHPNKTLILDRYWPTTIAYRLAHQTDPMSLHQNICWPMYLAKPSYIVYIYLDEKTRRQRIEQRHAIVPISDEERRIAIDSEFRARIDTIYRQIPDVYPLDGNQTIEAMVEQILKWIE